MKKAPKLKGLRNAERKRQRGSGKIDWGNAKGGPRNHAERGKSKRTKTPKKNF